MNINLYLCHDDHPSRQSTLLPPPLTVSFTNEEEHYQSFGNHLCEDQGSWTIFLQLALFLGVR